MHWHQDDYGRCFLLPFSAGKRENITIDNQKLRAARARKTFDFPLALWASNSQILFSQETSPLAQVFKLSINLWSQKWNHSLACWNTINPSDLFEVFIVFITFLLIACYLLNSRLSTVSEYHCFKSLKQCFQSIDGRARRLEPSTASCLHWAHFCD